ncbi:MAG: DUF922 domain-containing Zn-dependent protease [Alphaproteobacteria bacterium]|nr:DUF922 domain-containing Zn-dependent protease [Alphaproteobacteria bacterium]
MSRRLAAINRIIAGLTAGLAVIFLAGCAVTGTQIDKRSYTVHGETRADLKRDIRRRGPKGGSAYGLAVISFYPVYKLAESKGVCRVTSAEIGLHVVLTVPKWRGSKPANGKVSGAWRRFSSYVRYHEGVHEKIARDYARRMKSSLKKMASSRGCAELRRRVDARIKSLKRRHLRAQQAFDKREKNRIKHLI